MLEKCESYSTSVVKSQNILSMVESWEKKKKESVRQIHKQLDMLRKFVEKTDQQDKFYVRHKKALKDYRSKEVSRRFCAITRYQKTL